MCFAHRYLCHCSLLCFFPARDLCFVYSISWPFLLHAPQTVCCLRAAQVWLLMRSTARMLAGFVSILITNDWEIHCAYWPSNEQFLVHLNQRRKHGEEVIVQNILVFLFMAALWVKKTKWEEIYNYFVSPISPNGNSKRIHGIFMKNMYRDLKASTKCCLKFFNPYPV